MHEASIALNLIEAVEQRLESQPEARVAAIHVRVGELAGVSTEALDFAFQCLSVSTPLAGARLVFDVVPLTMACAACGRTSRVEDLVFRCPACGSENTRVSTGRELEVRTLELAEEPEVAHASD
ncbi:MAG TPA: hydrogenase maturation nickel metallochaperone HypA [Gemmatimonadales bacterium]|nr:hydrogenase maturation nickel metallochaperone HypA [Gemmatimonadales bacterium]